MQQQILILFAHAWTRVIPMKIIFFSYYPSETMLNDIFTFPENN